MMITESKVKSQNKTKREHTVRAIKVGKSDVEKKDLKQAMTDLTKNQIQYIILLHLHVHEKKNLRFLFICIFH